MTSTNCAHSSCSHHHHHEDEIDPCMAQEIAHAEKERILYEKLKVQSDRLLMNLNIRTNKTRVRGAVASSNECDLYSSDSEEACTETAEYPLATCTPTDFTKLFSAYKDKMVFILCIPCDFPTDSPAQVETELYSVFDEARRACKNRDVVFAKFTKRLCVCGRCLDADCRPLGTLRSVAMLLKRSPSVVLTRNGGLIGIWTAKDGPMEAFVSKNS
jgi:hypothetical protein